MEWYHYLSCFFAGAFLANFVPHFVHGISGNKFPTPFSKPRGVGLSSPATNVIWALVNLLIGYLLLHTEQGQPLAMLAVFAGIAAISIPLSIRFQHKHKE